MNWLKVSVINIFVLLALIIVCEIGLRLVWTGYQCYKGSCDFSRISKLKIRDSSRVGFTENNIGITRYDPDLGYIPNPGFQGVINEWNAKYVSIDENGFRENNSNNKKFKFDNNLKILTVGASATFGDEVNNDETWSACLEREMNQRVYNGGVSAYGAAQAIKRASLATQVHDIDTLIYSIYLNSAFRRDKNKFRSGWPRPAVVNINTVVDYADVPPITSIGIKYNPAKPKYPWLISIFDHSKILTRVKKLFGIDFTGMRRNEIHKNAATINEIINFSISEFEKIDVKKKLIVFQYKEGNMYEEDQASSEMQHIRDQVLKLTQQKGIQVVDPYKSLYMNSKDTSKKLWTKHYTPLGNKIVCREIIKTIKK